MSFYVRKNLAGGKSSGTLVTFCLHQRPLPQSEAELNTERQEETHTCLWAYLWAALLEGHYSRVPGITINPI